MNASKKLLAVIEQRDLLRAALIRMVTGAGNGEDFMGCEWYDGLAGDAYDEARDLLNSITLED